MDINSYNRIVAQYYLQKPELFMYSPAICRCEGQTSLFQKIIKNEKIKQFSLKYLLIFFGKIIRDISFSFYSPSQKTDLIRNDSIFVFSYFDNRNEKDGFLREEYFRNILDDENNIFCFYKLNHPGILLRGLKYIKKFSKLKKFFNANLEYSFITFQMVLNAIKLTYLHYFSYREFCRLNPEKNKIQTYIKRYHIKEIYDGTIYSGYLQLLLFEKIFKQKPKVVLSVWENQPWHRILEHVKNKLSPITVSKGFQHTGFSKKLLQHYPCNAEKKLNTYPDIVICNGNINRDELSKNTGINSKIITGGALRQENLINQRLNIKLLDAKNIKAIVFSFSWDKVNYSKILNDLDLLPKQIQKIYLKFHPMYPEWLNKNNFGKRFINSSENWQSLIPKVDLIIANDNSLIFEGYYYGKHTLIYNGGEDDLYKRDFNSPILTLSKKDLSNITKKEFVKKVNLATSNLIESKYLENYFVKKDSKTLKKIFFNI